MPRRAVVVVLGDLGHSPRMQYHCLSLARNGFDVDFLGYRGSTPHQSIMNEKRIKLQFLPRCPALPSILGLVVKLFWQVVTLFYFLTFRSSIDDRDLILLQNPPGLPAILVCFLASKLRKCKFLIDWHNYTYSIFGLKYGEDNFFVKLVKFYEFSTGKLADGGFCVTEAMNKDLAENGIQVRTFYDRPSPQFRPLDDAEKKSFLEEIAEDLPQMKRLTDHESCETAMIVSATSWTPDENFDLLLSALKIYDSKKTEDDKLPDLLIVITGKGPLKDFYVGKAKEYNFKYISLVTPWLKAEDYPKMLACADLGVSLHYSSSGFDLPMKAVDMQGCALPVLSADFRCVRELIDDGKNGFLFGNAQKLADLLILLLIDYSNNDFLNAMKRTCKNQRKEKTGWVEAWDQISLPYIKRIINDQ